MVCKDNKSLMRNSRKTFFFILLLIICVPFFSCQTTPVIPDVFMEDAKFVPLASGASVYIFADVEMGKSIINLLPIEELKDRQAAMILDRTNFVTAALFPPESGFRFQLAAWGNFPASRADMAFGMNKNWKKNRSVKGQSYWFSNTERLSIAIASKQIFAAASLNETPVNPFADLPGAEIPEGFNQFRQKAPLSCWLVNPDITIEQFLVAAGIPMRFPLRQLFVNIYSVSAQDGEQYEAVIRFQLESTFQARGMAAILGLAGNFGADDMLAAIFFANPPVQNGNNVDIKTAVLSESELLQFFNFILDGALLHQ
jgi:hypothetical protein